jgi:hypothetical protein
MKPTIANLRLIVAEAGGVLEDDGLDVWGVRTYQCVAPEGFYWSESDGYHLAVFWDRGDKVSQAGAFEDVVGRIRAGLREIREEERIEAGL